MRFSIIVATIAWLLTAALAQDQPQRKMSDAGDWRAAASEPDARGDGCQRVWVCTSRESVSLDEGEEIRRTAAVRTRGKCFDDNCRICRAPAPETACAWAIVDIASRQ